MKTASIATFLAVAAFTSPFGAAYERKLSDERRLGMGKYGGDASSKFEKYVDIYERCCAPDDAVLESKQTPCNCPVRTLKWFDIKSKWDNKCKTKIKGKSDLVALAGANGFDQLKQQVIGAGLVDVLKSDNEGKGYTVFAPTDEAFRNLPDGCTLEEIPSILKYHVVIDGTFKAEELADPDDPITSANTALGQAISINASNGVVINGGSTVIEADVHASNGVAHAIDTVLIPPGFCGK